MALKNRPIDTYRIIGSVGRLTFEREIDGTIQDARSAASQAEQRGDTDGIFRRGRAQIQKWTGSGWSNVDRYERR